MWEWLDKAKEFINKALDRVLSRPDIEQLIIKNQEIYTTGVDALTTSLVSDQISLADWETGMRELIKREYIQLYLLGRGGRDNMTYLDNSSIGGMLREQYRYLHQFAREIGSGNLTPGQILARARMYIRSSREGYNRATGRAYGIPEGALPAYPGDGTSCEGMTNCACQWEIREVPDGWDCYWRLGEAEHCKLCLEHEKDWAPFHIAKEKVSGIPERPDESILPKSWFAKALPTLLRIGVTAWLFSKLGKLFSVEKIDPETKDTAKALAIIGRRIGLDNPLDDGWDVVEFHPDEGDGSIVLKIGEVGFTALVRAQQALRALEDIGMNVLILTVIVVLKGRKYWQGLGADLLSAKTWKDLGG